jgi:hypothetical protein
VTSTPSHAVEAAPPTAPRQPEAANSVVALELDQDIHAVRIPVRPTTAIVTVDGEPVALHDGFLGLHGATGRRFHVVVRHGEQRLERHIVIDLEGRPSVEALELPPTVIGSAPPAPSPREPAAAPPSLAPSFVNTWGPPKQPATTTSRAE